MQSDSYIAADERQEPEPRVPTFFEPSDLPAWLRPDADAPVECPPAPPIASRARIAWAAPPSPAPLGDVSAFAAAATVTWSLLAPIAPAPARHPRRGAMWGTIAVLLAGLAWVAVVAMRFA